MISAIFAISSHGQYHHYIKGEKYPYKINEEGEVECHLYSDSPKLIPSSDHVIVQAHDITRKVILYPDPNDVENPSFYILVDHLRPTIPLKPQDVLIPFYPEKDDMVLVRGDGAGDVWLAHIHTVDKASQICQVYFYVETYPGSSTCTREHHGRRALEIVLWDSILDLAKGEWNGSEWNSS